MHFLPAMYFLGYLTVLSTWYKTPDWLERSGDGPDLECGSLKVPRKVLGFDTFQWVKHRVYKLFHGDLTQKLASLTTVVSQ